MLNANVPWGAAVEACSVKSAVTCCPAARATPVQFHVNVKKLGNPVLVMPNVPMAPVLVNVTVRVVDAPASKFPQLMVLGDAERFGGVVMLPVFWMVTESMTAAAA